MKRKNKAQLFGKLFFDEEMDNPEWQKAYDNFSKSKDELEKEKELKNLFNEQINQT